MLNPSDLPQMVFIGVNYCHVAMMNMKLSCQGQKKDPTVT